MQTMRPVVSPKMPCIHQQHIYVIECKKVQGEKIALVNFVRKARKN